MPTDDQVKQALGQVAKLGGFAIKRMATTDDMKDHAITITITRVSDGWHQERLQFEDDLPLLATVDGNGHVEDIVDPSDLTEKDETQAMGDPDEALVAAGQVEGVTPEPETIVAGEAPEPEVLRDPAAPLVGELAAAARKRR